MTIFVAIPSYRDRQLGPTVEDCIAKADYPGDLRFGVCWQHAEGEEPGLPDDPRVRLLDVDYRQARGPCWARAQVGTLFEGEDWYLGLDSHHRFVHGWDRRLLALAEATGAAKPLISGGPPGFDPSEPGRADDTPWAIGFWHWSMQGTPRCIGTEPEGWRGLKAPLRARFLAAGFLFTVGSWPEDVPYDPQLYSDGEEITLAVRSFTSGYDLFHPHEVVLWHEWDSTGRPKHGEAHPPPAEGSTYDDGSRRRARQLLLSGEQGRYGCGTDRTVAEYESYSGLDLARCRVQPYTVHDLEPPNPPAPEGWASEPRTWHLRLRVHPRAVPPAGERVGGDGGARGDGGAGRRCWRLRVSDWEGRLLDEAEVQMELDGGTEPAGTGLEHELTSAASPARWELVDEDGSERPRLSGPVFERPLAEVEAACRKALLPRSFDTYAEVVEAER
jgi:hypothetical protein